MRPAPNLMLAGWFNLRLQSKASARRIFGCRYFLLRLFDFLLREFPMPKKIILFADGTGNAFSTRPSNVWRIFEALDTSSKDQIAYYIPGVGTQSLWPLALFDSATGIGVPSNVRKLYRFLCWNWGPGDEIYMFGFSRGAFTIRTLIGLISSEGLVPRVVNGETVTRAEMRRNALAAWRSYRRKGAPIGPPVTMIARPIRDFFLELWHGILRHRRYDAPYLVSQAKAQSLDTVVNATKVQKRHGANIEIKFVGLFDTVEAFGVPIDELRWAIDKLIWPISFSNRQMSPIVRVVRQALSLDDERKTFHPLRIDRAIKNQRGRLQRLFSRAASQSQVTPSPDASERQFERVREVWFAGVHSDVGGGYPDDELAKVPLSWMLDELKATDAETKQSGKGGPPLRFRAGTVESFHITASPFGSLHDSRAGVAAFYRYSPRTVEAVVEGGKEINDVVVHHSVVERVVDGSDLYAPLTLPGDAVVLTPNGQPQQILDYLETESRDGGLSLSKWQERNKDLLDHASDLVWIRQLAYFSMLGIALSLLLLPLWSDRISDLFGDLKDENVVGGFVEAIETAAPSYLQPYLEAFRSHPTVIASLVAFSLFLYWIGSLLQDKIHDNVRRAWRPDLVGTKQGSAWNPLYQFARAMRKVNSSAPWLGRTILKGASGTAVAAVALAFVAGVVVLSSRIKFNYELGAGKVCAAPDAPTKKDLRWVSAFDATNETNEKNATFRTNEPCWASGLAVEKGAAYRLSIKMEKPWFDQLIMTDVGGFESNTFFRKIFLTPLLRWPSAGWFQPIARIDDGGDVEWPLTAIDQSSSLPAQGVRCSRLPIPYDETPEFCDPQQTSKEECLSRKKALSDQIGWYGPLPKTEYGNAELAWRYSKGKWKSRAGKDSDCESPYPRDTFVSDFVARKSGELFIFVNDALPFLWQDYNAFYKNNLGSAKVTLQRVPVGTVPTTTMVKSTSAASAPEK